MDINASNEWDGNALIAPKLFIVVILASYYGIFILFLKNEFRVINQKTYLLPMTF
jgi:hypothetical protein